MSDREERSEPRTLEEAVQQEVEAVARNHAAQLTDDLRERGLLGQDEEVVWDFGPVLGRCPHGVDLDREFCPEGCRV